MDAEYRPELSGFLITKSELWLGIVACAAGLPMVLLSPIGGVVVERRPAPHGLLIFTQTIQMFLAFILAALTFTGLIQVWHIVMLAFLLGITNALDMPARQAFVRRDGRARRPLQRHRAQLDYEQSGARSGPGGGRDRAGSVWRRPGAS